MSGVTLDEPAFYAYAYPELPGFREAAVTPATAHYHPALGEFILTYADARDDAVPAQAIYSFFQRVYEAAADLAQWDRANLEQIPPKGATR